MSITKSRKLTVEYRHIWHSVAYRWLMPHSVWVVLALSKKLKSFKLLALVAIAKLRVVVAWLWQFALLLVGCSCWSCIIRRLCMITCRLVLFALTFRLVSSGLLILLLALAWFSTGCSRESRRDGETWADENVLSEVIQIVECLTVNPDFFEA